MAERDPGDTRDPKRALIAAGLITAGFLGFALTGKQHTTSPGKLKLSEPLEKKAPPSHGRKDRLRVATIEGLKIGGELTDVPVLTLEHQTGRDYKFVPKDDKPAEDLIVVYSPALDRLLKEGDRKRFGGEEMHSFSTAFLFTSVPGGVMESLVAFNGKTKVVEDIYSGPGGLLPEGPVPLYDYSGFSPSQVGFTADIEQIPSPNGHGIELSVHGAPPEHSSAA